MLVTGDEFPGMIQKGFVLLGMPGGFSITGGPMDPLFMGEVLLQMGDELIQQVGHFFLGAELLLGGKQLVAEDKELLMFLVELRVAAGVFFGILKGIHGHHLIT